MLLQVKTKQYMKRTTNCDPFLLPFHATNAKYSNNNDNDISMHRCGENIKKAATRTTLHPQRVGVVDRHQRAPATQPVFVLLADFNCGARALGEILYVGVAKHRRLAEIVDDDADQLHRIADHSRLRRARMKNAAGDRLRESLRCHGVVFAVVDNAKPRPEQQRDEPLCRYRQRSNDAAIHNHQHDSL